MGKENINIGNRMRVEGGQQEEDISKLGKLANEKVTKNADYESASRLAVRQQREQEVCECIHCGACCVLCQQG